MSKVFNTGRLSVALLLAVAFTSLAACSKGGTTSSGSGPAAAARSYFEAITRKDFAAAKRYLSTGSASKMEAEAKEYGKPLEAAWRDSAAKSSLGKMPEIGGEKIAGDTATVDFKDTDSGMAFTFPMVKEGGEWKMAFDKLSGNNRILVGLPEASGPSGSPAASPAGATAPVEAKEEEGGGGEHNGQEEK
jgi:hypothetical protein